MEVIVARVRGISTSFRRILDYNYQRTYPLPPPTTIFGFLGAAIGLSDKQLWSTNSIIKNVKIAVLSLKIPGFAKDLWSIQKIKQGRIEELSPYFREILFFPEFLLIFGGDNEALRIIEDSLNNPRYALSLGREDELVRVIDLKREKISRGRNIFTGTILPFNIRDTGFETLLKEGIVIEPPIIDKLPTEFSIDKKGIRVPIHKKEYTFIPPTLIIKVKNNISGVYSVEGRNFVWLN